MRLTTKGRYGVTAMLDLAMHGEDKPLTLAEISQCQDISLSYLEQLFAKLRRGGLVSGVRGPGGGYRLTRPAGQISVADVIISVDEDIDITRCNGKENCQDGDACLTHYMWLDLSNDMLRFLQGISLADVVEQVNSRNGSHEAIETVLTDSRDQTAPVTSVS